MLRNPAYVGNWEWGKRSKKRRQGDTIPGYCPAIVSKEVFKKAGEILKQNQLFSARNSHREYLLRGLIKCAICGKTYCGSYCLLGPRKSKEVAYYRCDGKTQWKKLGKPRCPAPNLKGDEIEAVVWEDIKNFCKSPNVVLEQLRSQRKPIDESISDTLDQVSAQIAELKRQEINLIKISSTSLEANPEVLDVLLAENHRSRDELIAYKAALEGQKLRAETLEDDLVDVASRLVKLGDRIDQASFDERRRAVEELVREIQVQPQTIDGKTMPIVTITYRFNEPGQQVMPPPIAVVVDYTGRDSSLRSIEKHTQLPTRFNNRKGCSCNLIDLSCTAII